jgi:hypothetical protein
VKFSLHNSAIAAIPSTSDVLLINFCTAFKVVECPWS